MLPYIQSSSAQCSFLFSSVFYCTRTCPVQLSAAYNFFPLLREVISVFSDVSLLDLQFELQHPQSIVQVGYLRAVDYGIVRVRGVQRTDEGIMKVEETHLYILDHCCFYQAARYLAQHLNFELRIALLHRCRRIPTDGPELSIEQRKAAAESESRAAWDAYIDTAVAVRCADLAAASREAKAAQEAAMDVATNATLHEERVAEAAQRDAALAASREEKTARSALCQAGREAKQAQADAASMLPAQAAAARNLRAARALFIDAGEAARRAELEASADSTSPALAAAARETREIVKGVRVLFKTATMRVEREAKAASLNARREAARREAKQAQAEAGSMPPAQAAAARERRSMRALFIDAGRAAICAELEAAADSTSPALAAAAREAREILKAARLLFKNATMRVERAAQAAALNAGH
eukprot:gene1438-32812_t